MKKVLIILAVLALSLALLYFGISELYPSLIPSLISAETKSSETQTPETIAPETSVPETVDPETSVPETSAPESVDPETSVPETSAPETVDPETSVPETGAPESVDPETSVPETSAPESVDPETSVPETSAPESVDPETSVPETDAPETQTPICSHVLSEEWTTSNGKHYKTCVNPNCSYTTAPEDCFGGKATCTVPADCDACGKPYGTTAPHTWSEALDYTDNTGHAHRCVNRDCTAHSALIPHVPGSAATETTPQCCTECGYILTPVKDHTHTLVSVQEKAPSCTLDGCKAYYLCEGCNKTFTDAEGTKEITDLTLLVLPKAGHSFSQATCTSPKTCTRSGCTATEGTPVAHTPNSSWVSDAQSHWHTCTVCGTALEKDSHTPSDTFASNDELHWQGCTCGYKLQEERHADKDANGLCDLCTYRMSDPTPAETTPPTPGESTFIAEGEALEEILTPAQITMLRPEATGILTKTTSSATLDYSNNSEGYVMVQYTEPTDLKLKVKVQGPVTAYTYNLEPQEWTVFPLSDGSGEYKVVVYRNVTGTRYATVLSQSFTVQLESEFAPFLRPNQYVNFENATNTVNTAADLVGNISDTLKKVEAIYSFVVHNISYDYEKAATVQSGYLPDLDQVLASGKGICFDYASLMTGMLRSQNIPSKLIVGYADSAYHAWISVWTPDQGWVDGTIFFDGLQWQLMDPTFASTGGSTAMTGVTYTSKYIY